MASHYFLNHPTNLLPVDPTSQIMEQCDALAFHKNLPDYNSTPLVELPNLAKQHGVDKIYFKDEAHRFGLGAFKGLGAAYAIYRILQENPAIETFCTATDGNHGRAVAWSARALGKKAVVYVPKGTSEHRIAAIASEGAMVEELAGNYDVACHHAMEMSRKNGWQLVQDKATESYVTIPAWIMAGYQTLFAEMESSIHPPGKPLVDLVFMQAGVGSFAGSGIHYYLKKYGKSRPLIATVEPMEADALLYSMQQGKPATSTGNSRTIMAGLNCGTPSLGAWPLICNGTDVAMKVGDDYARKAMQTLYHPSAGDPRIVAGESGAGGLAGFLAIMKEPHLKPLQKVLNIGPKSSILFINTEGDTDPVAFKKIVSCSER